MKTQSLERDALYEFCDLLPAPIIAMPVLTATRGLGFTLSLTYEDTSVILITDGKPCNFPSVDAVMFELDGAPNVDTSRLVIDAGRYWKN